MANTKKPNVAPSELDKMQESFDSFEQEVKDLTLDRMNMAPKVEVEQQTKLSSQELGATKSITLKPARAIGSQEKFNEDYRAQYTNACQREDFIAENKEIIGETIELWTKPFAGMPAEFWQIPTNKLVNAPRYVRDQIQQCSYHRLTMENRTVASDGIGQYYGNIIADQEIQRLTATTPSTRRQFSMRSYI